MIRQKHENYYDFYFQSYQLNIILSIILFQMSKKKQSVDKTKDKSKKNNEQERIKQEALKLEQQKIEAKERLKVLQTSGILDAYQYFLRSVCKNGLPDANIFQFAAQKILKYQKKMKQNNQKKQQINNFNKSVIESPQRDLKAEKEKQKQKEKEKLIEKKQSIEKLKPSVLPFKGEVKQQVLKVLNKQKSPEKKK